MKIVAGNFETAVYLSEVDEEKFLDTLDIRMYSCSKLFDGSGLYMRHIVNKMPSEMILMGLQQEISDFLAKKRRQDV